MIQSFYLWLLVWAAGHLFQVCHVQKDPKDPDRVVAVLFFLNDRERAKYYRELQEKWK